MKFILSPAKIFKPHPSPLKGSKPHTHSQTQVILDSLKSCSIPQLQTLYSISESLATHLYTHLHHPQHHPAIYSYYGEAFKSIHLKEMTYQHLDYLQHHLLIYSALYGLLRPFDMIQPYRLDFLTPLKQLGLDNSFQTIKKEVTQHLIQSNSKVIVFICSQEFKDMIDLSELRQHAKIIDTSFISIMDGKEKIVSVHAKHARGAFLRACTLNNIITLSQLLKLETFDDWYLDHINSTPTHRIYKKTFIK